jgi:guanylate kinase
VIYVVSAPSGAGKTTLCKMAVERLKGLSHSISYTTRPPRPGETDGVEYHFVEEERFKSMIEGGEFVEHALVHGNRYGTARADLFSLVESGRDVMVEIDVQGANQIRKNLSGAVHVFILPPSPDACEKRLKARGKDSDEVIARRLRNALEEIREAPKYDYIIMNDDLEKAFEELKSVIVAEKLRKERMVDMVKEIFT